MLYKYFKKIRNRSRYLAHVVRHRRSSCSYEEFLRTEFDRRYGVETTSWVLLDGLETSNPTKEQAGFYAPTDPDLFSHLVRASNADPDRFTFIDLGCGKGRMLILAAESRFRSVVGVEFCPKLSAQARSNLDTYRRKFQPRSSLSVCHLDATMFEFPQEPLVIFFFNSFRGEVLRKVIENLNQSLKETPREVYFLWNGPGYFPELADIIEGHSPLRVHTRHEDFVIYKN